MEKKTKNRILIIFGVVIFLVVVGAGALGTVAYLVFRQSELQTTRTDDPTAEFAKARAQFPGQTPYIEFPEGDLDAHPIVHRETERDGQPPLNMVHALVWDPREHKVVRFGLPFWIVRLGGSHRLRLGSDSRGAERDVNLNVTARDLERRGRGIIIDLTAKTGESILVWVD